MQISKDMQKDILLESFEILKTDFDQNYIEINETIGKMAAIDINTSMDMWEHILNLYPNLITKSTDHYAYWISSNVIYNLSQTIGDGEASIAIKSRPKIKKAIFGISASVDVCQFSLIAEYISREDFDTATEVLQLVNTNKNKKEFNSGEMFQQIIDHLHYGTSDNSIDFIYHLIQEIEDPKEKAKANVRFLNLIK